MEIELKLALPPGHALRIRRHPLLQAIKPLKRTLHSIYFDTPAFDLMQRGIALRLRRVGYHWVQTMKAEARAVGAMSSRPEWEMAVAGGASPDFAVLPQAALDLLSGIDLARIAPVFVTEFQRTTWQVSRAEDQAELALDIGNIKSGDVTQAISEIEIELKAGAPDFLFEIAAQLLEQSPLHIEPRSKAERGYCLSGAQSAAPLKAVRPEFSPHQSAGAAWNAVMQASLAQCVANVPGFLEHPDEIEYLHQLRISMRRLRVGVSLARALGRPAPAWDMPLRESLRGLNAARDWDVFLAETLPKTRKLLEMQSAADGELLAALAAAAQQARQQAQTLLLAPTFSRLILAIGRDLLDVPTAPKMPEARQWAAKILEKRWLALRKRCRNFAKLNPEERHMARIAAKKMRYAADAFIPLYGKRGARFIDALAMLQNSLGSANDAHVGALMMHALIAEIRKPDAALAFDLGRIAGALENEVGRRAHLSGTIWRRLAQSRLFWRA
jgi:inorganic triphosphatase YgiF